MVMCHKVALSLSLSTFLVPSKKLCMCDNGPLTTNTHICCQVWEVPAMWESELIHEQINRSKAWCWSLHPFCYKWGPNWDQDVTYLWAASHVDASRKFPVWGAPCIQKQKPQGLLCTWAQPPKLMIVTAYFYSLRPFPINPKSDPFLDT